MRDENNSLSHHRIHLNWLTNKNTLSLITVTKWSTTTVKSFKQANLPFNSDTLHQWQSVPLYGIKIFPATLGLTCKQLKHTFCKDDWLIPGLRLRNMGVSISSGRSKHSRCTRTCAHTHTIMHSAHPPTKGQRGTSTHCGSASVASGVRGCNRSYKMKMTGQDIQLLLKVQKALRFWNALGVSCSAWRFSSLGSASGTPHLRWPRTVLPPHQEGVWKCESVKRETGEC